MHRWVEWLVMVLSSPVVLELIRRLGERLNRNDVPSISQLPATDRQELVRQVAIEAMIAAFRRGEDQPTVPEPVKHHQKGR